MAIFVEIGNKAEVGRIIGVESRLQIKGCPTVGTGQSRDKDASRGFAQMKKLLICLMIVSVSMFSLTGCGKKTDKKTDKTENKTEKKT